MVGQIHLALANLKYKSDVASLGPKKGAIKSKHIALINCFVFGTLKKKKKRANHPFCEGLTQDATDTILTRFTEYLIELFH